MQPTTTQDYILSNVRDKTKYRRSLGVTNAATVFLEVVSPMLDEAGAGLSASWYSSLVAYPYSRTNC
jgi:hypothetical protein